MNVDVEGLRELFARPILNLHGGYSCPRCAGALGGWAPLGIAPLCTCPMEDK